jgi:hypothetical protein
MIATLRVRILLVAGVVLSIFLATVPAQAQPANDPGSLNLTTSPLPISLTAKPGESVTTELRIKNGGSQTERLKVGLMKFSAYGEEGKPQLKDREAGDDYFDWVTFSETEFSAEPGKWQSIQMTVELPPEAALGYYYAVTFSRVDPPVGEDSNKILGGTAILVLVDARVENAKRQIEIDEFSASKRIYEFLPATFNIKLKNSGNIHLAPTGNIFISRNGTTIATLEVNNSAGNVLPQTSRMFSAEWADGFPVYKARETDGRVVLQDGKQVYDLKWELSKLGKLRFGRYTAHLVMSYDDGERDVPIEALVSFWVIPWRILFFTLIPIIAVILLVFKYLRLKKRLKGMEKHKGQGTQS